MMACHDLQDYPTIVKIVVDSTDNWIICLDETGGAIVVKPNALQTDLFDQIFGLKYELKSVPGRQLVYIKRDDMKLVDLYVYRTTAVAVFEQARDIMICVKFDDSEIEWIRVPDEKFKSGSTLNVSNYLLLTCSGRILMVCNNVNSDNKPMSSEKFRLQNSSRYAVYLNVEDVKEMCGLFTSIMMIVRNKESNLLQFQQLSILGIVKRPDISFKPTELTKLLQFGEPAEKSY